MTEKPKRHIEAMLTISADDAETFMAHLRQVLFDLDRGLDKDAGYYSVSGGYSSSHIIEVKVNKDITHDSWADELGRYLAEKKAEQP